MKHLGLRLTLNNKPVNIDRMFMKNNMNKVTLINSKRKTFMKTVKQNCSTGDTRAVLEVMLTSVQHKTTRERVE